MTCRPDERRQAHRAAHVVAEVQERGDVRQQAAVVGDAVGDAAHGVLADAEADVAAGLVGAELAVALEVGEVALRQVGGAAEQLRQACSLSAWSAFCEALRVARPSAPSARSAAGPRPSRRAARRRCGGAAPRPRSGSRPRRRASRSSQSATSSSPARHRLAEVLERCVRDVERLVGVPAVGLLGQADLVGAERRAVRLLGVLPVGRAVADVGAHRDEARPVVLSGGASMAASMASRSLPSSTRWVCQP